MYSISSILVPSLAVMFVLFCLSYAYTKAAVGFLLGTLQPNYQLSLRLYDRAWYTVYLLTTALLVGLGFFWFGLCECFEVDVFSFLLVSAGAYALAVVLQVGLLFQLRRLSYSQNV